MRFSRWRTQKASTCFSWKPVFPPLKHQTGGWRDKDASGVLPFHFTLLCFYASLLQWQLFGAELNPDFCLISASSTTIWAIRRWNRIPQVRWENRAAWWLPAIPAWLCALGGYIIHKNMLEKSEPLRYIYFYVLWYLHWSNATLNNLIVECCWLVSKITRENNEEPNRFPSVFIWKQQVLESVGFSDLQTVPWRSLLSAFNH